LRNRKQPTHRNSAGANRGRKLGGGRVGKIMGEAKKAGHKPSRGGGTSGRKQSGTGSWNGKGGGWLGQNGTSGIVLERKNR